MSETKEFSLEQARVNDDTNQASGVHSGSARTSQKLDVKLLLSKLCLLTLVVAHPLTLQIEIPVVETCRCVCYDSFVLVDGYQLNSRRCFL